MPLTILDDDRWAGGLDRDALAKLVADGVQRFGWRVVVLDYLNFLVSREPDQFQADLLNSAALRRLSRKHDLALVVVAALRKTRATDFKDPAKISLDDVAGAGRLCYDAQNVLLVWREHGDDDTGLVHVRTLKVRFGATRDDADLQFRWRPRTGLITDLEGAE